MMKEKRFCKNCGKEFIPCHKTSEFCSKSCATTWRNKEKKLKMELIIFILWIKVKLPEI